jgi:hypothetical protein
MKGKVCLLILLLFIVLIIINYYFIYEKRKENFTLNVATMYHPHKRNIRNMFENFTNNYGSERFYYLFRKFNIL